MTGKAKGVGANSKEVAGEGPKGKDQEEPLDFKIVLDSPNQGTPEGDDCVHRQSHSPSDKLYWIMCEGFNAWYKVTTNGVGLMKKPPPEPWIAGTSAFMSHPRLETKSSLSPCDTQVSYDLICLSGKGDRKFTWM